MATLTEVAARRRAAASAQLREATIRSDPDDVTDELLVSVDAAGSHLRGPCRGWAPRGALWPAVGDRALVAHSDTGRLWIVAWWPA